MNKMLLAAAAATAMISSAAFAAVTFDPATGTGFVGKGDIQLPMGWNNKQLQNNAGGVTFTYDSSAEYAAVCTFTTGEGTRGERTHNVSHKVKTGVNSAIAFEARRNSSGKDGDITGFHLTGLGNSSENEALPEVGGFCMGNAGHDGLWTSVTLTSEAEGGLSFSFGGISYPLPITPTL